MKKLIAGLLLAVTVCSVVGCGSTKAELDDQAAVREYDPNDTTVYIEDESTALIGSIDNATMTEAERQRSAELRAMAVEAFDAVNAQRVAVGLPMLVWSDDLAVAAQVRATEIVSVFSHTRPNGTDWWTVNGNIMYGENLARGYKTAASCVSGWIASPTHYANLMDGGFVTCGIAIYEDSNGKLYWAQEFGY